MESFYSLRMHSAGHARGSKAGDGGCTLEAGLAATMGSSVAGERVPGGDGASHSGF